MLSALVHDDGGSTSSIARRRSQKAAASATVARWSSRSADSAGSTTRLTRSTSSRAARPAQTAAVPGILDADRHRGRAAVLEEALQRATQGAGPESVEELVLVGAPAVERVRRVERALLGEPHERGHVGPDAFDRSIHEPSCLSSGCAGGCLVASLLPAPPGVKGRRASGEAERTGRARSPCSAPSASIAPRRAAGVVCCACSTAQVRAKSATSSQPSWLTMRCVRPANSRYSTIDGAAGGAVLLHDGLADGGRHDVVDLAGDDEQRRAVGLGVVDVAHPALLVEGAGDALEEHPVVGVHGVLLPDAIGCLAAEVVAEGEVEVRLRDRLGAVPAERVGEDRRAGPERREGERRDARGLAGGDADVGDPEAAVGEHLGEQPAEGVAHDDRLLRQGADDALVVVGDLLQADALQGLGVRADVGDLAVVDAGPARDDDLVAAGPEVLGPGVPALRGHPQAVDEDDGGLLGGGHVRLLLRAAVSIVRSRTIVLSCCEANIRRPTGRMSSKKRKIVLSFRYGITNDPVGHLRGARAPAAHRLRPLLPRGDPRGRGRPHHRRGGRDAGHLLPALPEQGGPRRGVPRRGGRHDPRRVRPGARGHRRAARSSSAS